MPVALDRYAFVLHLLYTVASQGSVFLEFSENPVYNSSRLTLFCRFATNVTLTNVTVDAFNGTRRVGSLQCSVPANNSYGTGLFSAKKFNGCPTYVANSGNVKVSMEASPNLELDYNCSVTVNDGNNFYNWTSDSARLQVRVMPEPVLLNHGVLNFNESDNVTLACYSRHGKPPAIVNLTVTPQEQSPLQDIGNISAFLQLPQSKSRLNNAIVTCKVGNHRISHNMTYQGILNINYLDRNKQTYYEVVTTHNSATLNCSASSNPPAMYSWEIPSEIKGSFSPLNEFFIVPKHSSGKVKCTILNPVTREQVVVSFDVKSSFVELVVGVTIAVIIIIGGAVVVLVLYRRGRICSAHKQEAAALRIQKEPQGTCGTHISPEKREVASKMLHPEDCQYQPLNLQTMNEQSYEQFAVVLQAKDSAEYEVFLS